MARNRLDTDEVEDISNQYVELKIDPLETSLQPLSPTRQLAVVSRRVYLACPPFQCFCNNLTLQVSVFASRSEKFFVLVTNAIRYHRAQKATFLLRVRAQFARVIGLVSVHSSFILCLRVNLSSSVYYSKARIFD